MKDKGIGLFEKREQIDDELVSGILFEENEKPSLMDLDIESPSFIKEKGIPRSLSDIPETITSVESLDDLKTMLGLLHLQGYGFLFRGHASKSFELSPTIVRNKVRDFNQEKVILESFKSICQSFGYDKYWMKAFDKNLYYLGIGRHLGLFSRLLDWTAGIDDALSFLMDEKFKDSDGELCILAYQKEKLKLENRDPFLINDNRIHILQEHYYCPDETDFPLGIYRRFRQHGFFTVQAENLLNVPLDELEEQTGISLVKVSIPKEIKALIKGCDNLVSLDWLYVDKDEPVLKEIDILNGKFKKVF